MKSATGYPLPRAAHDPAKTLRRAAWVAPHLRPGPPPHRFEAHLRPLSLRHNFLWIAAGNAVDAVAQWARVVVLAHLGNLEMVGTLVLAFAICTPIYALAGLGLRTAVVTDAKHEFQFADYLGLRLITAVLALLLVAGIVLTAGYERQTVALILLVGLGELFKSVGDIFHALLQQQERMDRIAVSLTVQGVLMVMLLALGILLSGDLLWGIAGYPLVTGAALLSYDLPNGWRMLRGRAQRLCPRWDGRRLLRLTWLAAPLGAILTMVALTTSVPRFMVSHYLGNEELGVFVSIFYVGVLGGRVVNAIASAAGPRLSKHYAAGELAAYRRLLGKLVGIVVGLGAAVVLAMAMIGVPLLNLLYRADYTGCRELAVYLMLAAAATYLTVPLGIAVEAMRRFKTHMVIRGAGVFLLVVLSPGFITAWGMKGAAATILVSCTGVVLGCAAAITMAARKAVA